MEPQRQTRTNLTSEKGPSPCEEVLQVVLAHSVHDRVVEPVVGAAVTGSRKHVSGALEVVATPIGDNATDAILVELKILEDTLESGRDRLCRRDRLAFKPDKVLLIEEQIIEL